MKLRVRFVQLPILFDASKLAAEVAAIPQSAWRAHPQGFVGNDALPLVTTGGDPSSDARVGAMGPTPSLLACPYLMQVLDDLGATWGRSRLMRLSGDAEVSAHIDTDYYWRDHMRVHVPIVTQPTVRFLCGDETVNMAAGECWIFDTWSLHSVHNDAKHARIHLVADTVGGDGLMDLVEKGRSSLDAKPDWAPKLSPPRAGQTPKLAYESRNTPDVMTPWELRDHLGFLMGEVVPGDPKTAPIVQVLNRMRVNWHALWARSGDDADARPEYAELLAQAWTRLETLGVNSLMLNNKMSLGFCLRALIFNAALSSAGAAVDSDDRAAPVSAASAGGGAVQPAVATRPAFVAAPQATVHYKVREPAFAVGGGWGQPAVRPQVLPSARAEATESSGRDALFDRPIFIISPPRSGSTLLFETLSAAPGLHTIGGEAHSLMEAIPALTPAAHDWASNRLTAADADPTVVTLLRQRFREALRDRTGARPSAGPARLLEKTPKNALRIPFLAAAFPEARFIYLHRDPRPTLASMMEAWSTGRFQTYLQLPGWTGPAWSLLLTPGWRDLIGAPLNRIVAVQWATATRIMLDDLAALPKDRWRSISYDSFVANPQEEAARLCRSMDLDWDRSLDAQLPHARYTVSAPAAEKWRVHEAEIEAVAPLFASEAARAAAMMG